MRPLRRRAKFPPWTDKLLMIDSVNSRAANLQAALEYLSAGSGHLRETGQSRPVTTNSSFITSTLRRQWLAEPQVVAAGVADGGVTDAVGLVDGLLKDLGPGGTQRLESFV